jgi:tRNA pseudouridine38-40 synthase
MSVRLDLEYDGTSFAGWARQRGLRTVQEELERALSIVAREPIGVVVAGRTDAGVHASGQICSYEGPLLRAASLNGVLPPDIAVTGIAAAPDGFDARRWARSRSYAYRILARRARSPFEARFALHHPRPLDLEALRACAALLPGEHDFTAFTPTETEHVRFTRVVRSASWEREADLLTFSITADAFLRSMNRVLVGTMLEVGVGKRSLGSFAALLDGADRSAAGPTAHARGLHLVGVELGDGPLVVQHVASGLGARRLRDVPAQVR